MTTDARHRTVRRDLGLTALALGATLVVAISTETAGPDSSATAHAVVTSFVANRAIVLVSGVLFLVASALGVALATGVSSLPWETDRQRGLARLATSSCFLAIALLSVYASGLAGLAASIGELREHQHLVYALFRVISAIDDASGVFIAIFIAVTGRLLASSRLVSRRVAQVGYTAAAVRAVGVLDVTTLGGLPFGPFMVGGTLLCLAWLFALGVSLVRGESRPR